MMLARSNSDRLKAAAGVIALELALIYALIAGLSWRAPDRPADPLKAFGILPPEPVRPPPPPRPTEPRQRTPEREGAASPPNLKSIPTEIVVPPPPLPLPLPPPMIAAPIAGAAPVPGPGTGAGGKGNGSGSGNGGDGPGGGGSGGSPPRWLKGRIGDRDYPRSASESGIGGIVEVTFRVGTDGRAGDCWISQSSGNRDLDITTCRLIEERHRYRPARDRSGRPVAAWLIETHEWVIEREPAPPADRRR